MSYGGTKTNMPGNFGLYYPCQN